MPLSQEAFVEAQYTEGLTIGWEYEPPTPDRAACLEDARQLAEMFKANLMVSKFEALRHIEASAGFGTGQITAKTTQMAIDNQLLPGVILTVTRSWMKKGVHRNVYCRQDGYQSCLLYTSDAADDMQCVDLGGRRIIKKK